jgi:hypothetical protein
MSRRHNDIARRTVDDPSGTRVRRRHTGGKQRPHRRDRAWISRRRHLTRRCSTRSSRGSSHSTARPRTASGDGDRRKHRRGSRPHCHGQIPRSHQPSLTSLVAWSTSCGRSSNCGLCACERGDRRAHTCPIALCDHPSGSSRERLKRGERGAPVGPPGPSLVWLRTFGPGVRARRDGAVGL